MEKFLERDEDKELVKSRLTRLHEMIEGVPKSMRWKLRAKIGEKKRWYDLPEFEERYEARKLG